MWIVRTTWQWILIVLSVVRYIFTQSPSTDATVIDAKILFGSHRDKRVLIPRLVLVASDIDLPLVLHHQQFLLHLAWAMTISKVQRQTFEKVSIHLDKPVFARGQLYVAFQGPDNF